MAEKLRNHCILAPEPPTFIPLDEFSGDTRPPKSGDLWVDSNYFVIYCFDENEVHTGGDNPCSGWIGVTDKTNNGSIVYFSENEPDLTDIYPALKNMPDGVDGVLDGPIVTGKR